MQDLITVAYPEQSELPEWRQQELAEMCEWAQRMSTDDLRKQYEYHHAAALHRDEFALTDDAIGALQDEFARRQAI